MYGASSPIFDTPELPGLRRVKPLPKRRRTLEAVSRDDALSELSFPELLSPDTITPDASAQGLEDALSAQLSLPSYYRSLLSGVKDILKAGMEGIAPAALDVKGAGLGGGRGGGGRGFDDDGDGDYVDHLQQPGNTKKRKVPANLVAAGHAHESGSVQLEDEDEQVDRAIPTGRPESEYDSGGAPPSPESTQGGTPRRRGKLTKAMLASLQHKEMLKNRKRQLAAVLGALTQGDTLALDQALSANYPFTTGIAGDQEPPKIRPSKRRPAVLARAFKNFRNIYDPPEDTVPFPTAEFTFTCSSATSDRLRATKEEVAALHARFEAELKRQAAKASEVARQTSAVLTGTTPTVRKTKQGRTTSTKDAKASILDQNLLGNPPAKTKKKKRSARANASNPHHLRNYVPSRLPHSGQANASTLSAQDFLSPLPIRFLSTEIPPRRRKKSSVKPVSSPNSVIEEWICPFCEYDLFYGSDDDYRRAISSRKKILKRRRRARERAAAAANGSAPAAPKHAATPGDVAPAEYDRAQGQETAASAAGYGSDDRAQRGGTGEDINGSNVAHTSLG